MNYSIAHIMRRVIDLTGLRPFKLPHTRGEPLVNPPEGLCGAKIPRRAIMIIQTISSPAIKATVT